MPDYIYKPGTGPQQPRSADPLDDYFQSQQTDALRQTILAAPPPDAMAKQTQLAAANGVHPADVVGVESDAERAIRARNMGAVAQAHPAVGAWAVQNPRQAVAASDDHKSLGMLGQAWDAIQQAGETAFKVTAPINPVVQGGALWSLIERATGYQQGDLQKTAIGSIMSSTGHVIAGAPELAKAAFGRPDMSGVNAAMARFPGLKPPALTGDALGQFGASVEAAGKQIKDSVRTHGVLSQAVDLAGSVVPFAAAGAYAPAAMAATGAADQADAARKAGKYGTAASDTGILANAAYQATLGHVLGMAGGFAAPYVGDALGRAVGASVARITGDGLLGFTAQGAGESLGKLATQSVQAALIGGGMQAGSNLIEQQTVNPQRSLLEGTGDSALSMVALDLMMHGMHAVLGKLAPGEGDPTQRLAQAGQDILPRVDQAVQGMRDAAVLDMINRAATDSAFKARDPEGWSALVKHLADEKGIDTVYVSPEAIRSYQQSDSYDRYSDPFAAHSDAISEAEATGGDVALPVEFVLGDLAGTKAFSAVKDGIRLRADGMTGGEARELADHVDEMTRKAFDALTEQDQAAAKEQDARSALVERLTGEIQNAGYTPRNAAIMAELVGQRAATRAARLGRSLQPGDFDTRIVRVLPPSVEAARKADGLDLAINAMRKGGEAEKPADGEQAKPDKTRAAADDLRRMIEAEGRDPAGMTDKEIRALVEKRAREPAQGSPNRVFQQAVRPEILADINASLRGEKSRGHIDLGQVSAKLSAYGISEGQISIGHGKLKPIARDHPEMTADVIASLPRATADPWAIFPTTDQNHPERIIVATKLRDEAGNPILVALQPTDEGAVIVSAYAKTPEGGRSGDDRVRAMIATEKAKGNKVFEGNAAPASYSGPIPDMRPERAKKQILSLKGKGKEFKQEGQEPRGRILMPADGWGSAPATIELFQKANLSTLVHELGHQWLEELRFDAEHPEASEQLKQDWAAVQKWFADQGYAITGGEIPVDAHEVFARGIERYLMEGKAPTKGIAGIFEKIRGWMVNIYRTVDALRSPITPEIRQVFDRLLATDEEIAASEKGLALNAGFEDAKALGMTDAEAQAYGAISNGARDEANRALLEKTMAAERRKQTAAWNEERRGVRAEETARLEETPLFTALRVAKERPLDREWIVDRFGEDALSLMPKRVPPMFREGGAHPDDVAEMSGYESGEEMIRALMGAEKAHQDAKAAGDVRTLRNRIIDQATDTEMTRRHGDDPFNDGSVEEKAAAIVNEKLGGKLLEAQLKFLGEKSGNVAALYSIARTWARNKVRTGVVAAEAMASAVQRHTRAVAKAGREAEKAMLAGKWNEAFQAKQRQMIASALLAEAKAAQDEVTRAADALAKIAKRKTMASVDQDYLDQAHALLDDVQLGPRSQKSIERQGKWADWAAARAAEGYDVVVPASFEATINGTHWTRLTVEQLLGLKDAVDQVMHLGKLKQTLIDGQEQRTWDSIYREAENSAGAINGPAPKDLADMHAPGMLDAIAHGITSIDAALVRMETLFDWLDGGNPNGVFNRIAFKPIAEAQVREHTMLKDYLGSLKDMVEAVPSEDRARWNDRLTMPWMDARTERPMVLTRDQVIAMALNIGNEGNLQRLTDGYRMNADAVQDFLNRTLTAGEWRFVQGVWDHIDTLWPQIEALEKRVNGVAPEKVEARSFDTPHGSLRGGYYPAVYDSTLDLKADERRGSAANLLESNYTRATTRAGATKERADQVRAPILLDLGVINRHLAEVIHDITHREAVMQAWKFLGSERVQAAVTNALGREYTGQFRPWVKSVANSMTMDRAGNEALGKFLRGARMNVTMVGLGLRATTIMVHTSGLAAGASVIGEKAMAHGLATMARNPSAALKFVLDSSGEVRGHLEHYERDIGTMLDGLDSAKATSRAKKLVQDGQRFALYGIGWMVQRVSVPIWIGAYDKAVGDGMAHEDAVFAADKAVRYSLGAAGPKDLAAVQRSSGNWGEAIKMLTMFYTAMGSQYQRDRTLARDVVGSDTRRPRNVPKLASRAFWAIAMVPLWDAAVRLAIGGAGPDKDEWWSAWLANKMVANLLGPIPLARELYEPVVNAITGHHSRSPSITPLQGAFDAIYKSAQDAGALLHGKKAESAVKDALLTAGYITGMVPGQIASAAQYLTDVANGSAHPQTFQDWVNGLSTGHEKKPRPVQ